MSDHRYTAFAGLAEPALPATASRAAGRFAGAL